MRPHHPHRPAFRLIELLLVIALVAFAIGLLLPATRRVREAPARTQCQNNLRQILLAAQNYASAHGNRLPPLTCDKENSDGDSLPYNGGILLTLLPFVEANTTFSNAIQTLPECTWYAPFPPATAPPLAATPPVASNQPLCVQRLRVYECPADATIHNGFSTNQMWAQTDGKPYVFPWAAGSYAANYQVFGTENDFGGPGWGNYCGPKYRMDKLPDGASNTAFFGEQFAACGSTAGSLWAYPGIGNYSGPEYSSVPGAQAPAGINKSIVNTPEATNSKLWFPVFANGHATYGFTAGGVEGSIYRHNNQKPAPAPIIAPFAAGQYWDAPPQYGVLQSECDKSRLQSFHTAAVLVGMGDGSVRTVSGAVSQHSWYCAIVPDDGIPFDSSW
jgi:type II secretory pathway pseudopilin PulG